MGASYSDQLYELTVLDPLRTLVVAHQTTSLCERPMTVNKCTYFERKGELKALIRYTNV